MYKKNNCVKLKKFFLYEKLFLLIIIELFLIYKKTVFIRFIRFIRVSIFLKTLTCK